MQNGGLKFVKFQKKGVKFYNFEKQGDKNLQEVDTLTSKEFIWHKT